MTRPKSFTNEQVVKALRDWIVANGQPPTLEELRRVLHAGSTRTIHRYLKALEVSGEIRRWPGARGIKLLRNPAVGSRTVEVPIVGEAPAGPLMLAEENREGSLRLPTEFVRPVSAPHYLLRVRGNSMNKALISGEHLEDRDLVLVKHQSTADTGDIVVALLDGETTIKTFVKARGYCVLKPSSSDPRHQPIVVRHDFRIRGIVKRVLKRGSDLLG